MKDTYTYQIGDNLYINLTNRCTNRCAFCVRDQSEDYEGYSLWLKGPEPTAEQIISELGDVTAYREIVFCGYGEPTFRLAEMLEICAYVHQKNGTTRLNTNGHGNAVNGRDITPKLKGALDGVNISLNAENRNGYERLCRPLLKNGFEEMLAFADCCKKSGVNCWFSVVDCIGQERVEACRDLASSFEIPLRIRKMIDNREK